MLKWGPLIVWICDVYIFGMLLFEMVRTRKSAEVVFTDSLDWFPKHVWDEYEKGELATMIQNYGIDEMDRESTKNGYGGIEVCLGLTRGQAVNECCGENVGRRSGDHATPKTIPLINCILWGFMSTIHPLLPVTVQTIQLAMELIDSSPPPPPLARDRFFTAALTDSSPLQRIAINRRSRRSPRFFATTSAFFPSVPLLS
ncbi:hypothetical protein RHSIM_Rhsim11G0029600 [Rhododendron simsii]|uniref:Uncharacterized protein n=1 Tax=Rhododendron simsii TaxID=118357 RepID=A0A834G8Z1_RHOSS|nr:hypothetical protein RHSIM_Rhsim11G0029600 [Rhododendron simsii]